MSLLGTWQWTKSSPKALEIASRSLFAFLYPAFQDYKSLGTRKVHQARRQETSGDIWPSKIPPSQKMDNCFSTARARAGSCRWYVDISSNRSTLCPSTSTYHRARRKLGAYEQGMRSIHSMSANTITKQDGTHRASREELHSLVDIYDAWRGKGILIDDVGLGPEVRSIPWEKEGYFTDNRNMTSSEPGSHAARILDEMKNLLESGHTPDDTIFELYMRLPGHRVSNVSSDLLHMLLSQFSVVPVSRLHDEHLHRWMTILHDMQASSLPVNVALWTTAIRFTGWRQGLDDAFRMWRTMENQHQVQGNHYTMSVLFDLASHNGQFALAEMVDREARARGLKLDRVSRMSRIFYYGVLGDGLGVRRAYAQLVEAGEIVDTAVLTNVIQALLHAGEVSAAEETFHRMKRFHAAKSGATSTPTDWRQSRQLKRLLTRAGHQYRGKPQEREIFQQAAPINPGWRTYRAFIRYHAVGEGNYHRTQEWLEEMKRDGIGMNSELYHLLFEAFQHHGNIRHSAWSMRNLDILWGKLLWNAHEAPWETFFNARLAERIVRAFFKCGGKERGWWVWDEIMKRWIPPPGLREKIVRILDGGISNKPR